MYLPHSRSHFGFTLIELLVVLAVISLLMAILLPVLGKARTLTRRVVCAAHLRQIGLAWHQYLDENAGKFYRASENAEYTYGGWKGIYYPDTPRPLNRYVNANLPELPETESQAKAFHCPADNGSIGFSVFQGLGTSYTTNILLTGQDQTGSLGSQELTDSVNRTLASLTWLKTDNPARLVLVGDYGWGSQWLPSYDHGSSWHGRHCHWNLAFLDGHVNYLPIRKGIFDSDDYTVLPSKDLYELAREVQEEIPCKHK